MACSSCGQRYRKATRPALSQSHGMRAARRASRQYGYTQQVSTDMSKEPAQSSTPVEQPQPAQAETVVRQEFAVEPVTGLPLSVITDGTFPQNSLGDTQPAPITGVFSPSSEEANG
jgi:hypothetical protein